MVLSNIICRVMNHASGCHNIFSKLELKSSLMFFKTSFRVQTCIVIFGSRLCEQISLTALLSEMKH